MLSYRRALIEMHAEDSLEIVDLSLSCREALAKVGVFPGRLVHGFPQVGPVSPFDPRPAMHVTSRIARAKWTPL